MTRLTTLQELLLIAGMCGVTFGVRWLSIVGLRRRSLPGWAEDALRYVPIAALSAIAVPAMVLRDGVLALSLDNAHLVAGLMAIAVAWWTRRLFLTLAGGLLLFAAWRWLLILAT